MRRCQKRRPGTARNRVANVHNLLAQPNTIA